MNKDRIAGSAKEIDGVIRFPVGKAVGGARPKADGKGERSEGTVVNLFEPIRDTPKP
jgi:uncharacterized protein YjbJ (UPF0337 family)